MDIETFHASRRFAEVKSGRIAYIEQGQGPAALFVHGVPLNGYHWRHVIDRLKHRRRCIAIDLLGLGYSEIGPLQDVSFTAQAQVANGASEFFIQVLGDAGKHARSAVGMAVLPLDSPVEVELIAEVA